MQVIFLLHYLGGAIPFHAIDEYVLVAAVYALTIVVLGFWVIPDVGDVQPFDRRVGGADPVDDLTWKDNRTLTCEAFFFSEYAMELHSEFPR